MEWFVLADLVDFVGVVTWNMALFDVHTNLATASFEFKLSTINNTAVLLTRILKWYCKLNAAAPMRPSAIPNSTHSAPQVLLSLFPTRYKN